MKKTMKLLSVVLAVLMLISSLSITVSAAGDHVAVYNCTVGEEIESFEFRPDADGWYLFYTDCEYDTYADLLDSDGELIDYSDDNYDGYNFYLKAELQKGETYILEVDAFNGGEEANFDVYVDRTAGAVSAVVTKEPDDVTVVENCEVETMELDGLEVEFTLSDGRKVPWSFDEYGDVDGSVVYCDYGWTDDGEMFACVMCDSAYAEQYFVTVETPVERVEYKGPAVEYYLDTEGYFDDYLGYYVYDEKLIEGSMITIYYKDGGVEEFSYYSTDDLAYGYLYSTQYEEPWVLGDDNSLILSYLGAEVEVPVTIKESRVADIQVTKSPDKYRYEDAYYPVWDGAEFTVLFKDGTEEKIAFDGENVKYGEDEDGYLRYLLDVDGEEFEINYGYDYEADYEFYTLTYEGVTTEYDGFEFVDTRKIKEIVPEQFTFDGEGILLNVDYTNGEKERFEFDVVYGVGVSSETGKYHYGFTLTDNGIAYFSTEKVYDEETENFIGYGGQFLGEYYFVESPSCSGLLGDVDENGTVNIKDVTAIQKHTAGILTLPGAGVILADTDNSGGVNVKDATATQKWLAGIETGYGIGEMIRFDF